MHKTTQRCGRWISYKYVQRPELQHPFAGEIFHLLHSAQRDATLFMANHAFKCKSYHNQLRCVLTRAAAAVVCLLYTTKLCSKYSKVSARFTATSLQRTALSCATRLPAQPDCLSAVTKHLLRVCNCVYVSVWMCMRASAHCHPQPEDNRMLPQAAELFLSQHTSVSCNLCGARSS